MPTGGNPPQEVAVDAELDRHGGDLDEGQRDEVDADPDSPNSRPSAASSTSEASLPTVSAPERGCCARR
jgi:hypothetical protein